MFQLRLFYNKHYEEVNVVDPIAIRCSNHNTDTALRIKNPRYNTAICSKLHGKLFEYFIRHALIDIYHIMCSIITHDKQQPSYEDEEISIGDRPILNNATK